MAASRIAGKERLASPGSRLPLASRAEREHINGARWADEDGMKRVLAAFLMMAAAFPAWALESAPVSSKRAVATLVTDTDAMQPGKPFRVGLRLTDGGWLAHLLEKPRRCRRAAGLDDRGCHAVADRLADTAARRRGAGDDLRLHRGGAAAGHGHDAPRAARYRAHFKAHAQWLVCKDICVPEEGDFSLTLPVGTPGPSAQAKLFAAHDRTVPRPSPWAARISPDGTLFVQGPELSTATVTDAWFIPDQPDRIQDDAAQPLSVRVGGFTLALKPAKGFDPASDLSGVLSVRDRAGMQTDVADQRVTGPPPAPAMPPLGQILVFAFLGGLILNLMPCVFPILAMKAVAFARHAGRGHGHAVSYTAGRAGDVRGSCRATVGREGGGHGGGLGLSVFLAGVRGGDDVAAFRGGAEPVGRLRGRRGPDRCRRRSCRSTRLWQEASSPGCWRCWWRRLARPRSWGSRWRPGWRHRRSVTVLVFAVMGIGFGRALRGPGLDAGPRPADAAARPVDGGPQAGAGVPDVRRGGLAGLGR